MVKRSSRSRDSGYASQSRSRGRSRNPRVATVKKNERALVKYNGSGKVSRRRPAGDEYYGGVVNNIAKNYSRYFDPSAYFIDALRTGFRGLQQTFTRRPSEWRNPSRGTVYEPLTRLFTSMASGPGIGGVGSNPITPSKRKRGTQEMTPVKRRQSNENRPAKRRRMEEKTTNNTEDVNSYLTMGNVKMQSASIKEAWVKFVVNNPKRKKYVGRPIYYLVQDADQISSSAGVQDDHIFACFGSKSQWLSASLSSDPSQSQKPWIGFNPGNTFRGDGTFYANGTLVSDQKFALQSVNYELHLSNIGELPVMMDMYYISARKWMSDFPDGAWSIGTTNQQYLQGAPTVAQPTAGNTGDLGTFGRYTKEIIGSVPEKFRYFRECYKIHKKVSINLDPGETKVIHHTIIMNMVVNKAALTENLNAIPRNCTFVYGVYRGVPCVDKTDPGNLKPTWSPAVISYCEVKKHKFRQVRGTAETDVDAMLATSAVSQGASFANLGFVKDATDEVETGFNNA